MKAERGAAVRRRLADTRRRLWTAAAEGDDYSRLKAAQEEVSLLSGLAQDSASRRRRTALRIAFFSLLALAGVLHLLRMPEVDVAVAATTRAMVLSSGSASEVVLEGLSVEALSVDSESAHSVWCEAGEEAPPGCRAVNDLVLDALTVHAHSRWGISRADACVEFVSHEGGMTFDLSYLGPDEPYGVGDETLRLGPGDKATICGTLGEPLTLARPQRLVLGRESATPAVRPVAHPTLVEGVVVVASIAREHPLLPTDSVMAGGLRDGFVTVELGEPLKVSLTGDRKSVV